ncbi:hypothetical protein AQUCO_00400671v1 [Aquilegia coerulea]|uniref:Uncharacterized protein n=1 Tax=Aquilegia coerulea TaxID=218851 RepID=A0A2G5EW45_AQUCA|nr:hypothetical protein AQUCO_00400671v1 [Aquilegia coerulea]
MTSAQLVLYMWPSKLSLVQRDFSFADAVAAQFVCKPSNQTLFLPRSLALASRTFFISFALDRSISETLETEIMANEGSNKADVEEPLLLPTKVDAKPVEKAEKNKDIPFWYIVSMAAAVLIHFSMINIIVVGFSETQRMLAFACLIFSFIGILVLLYLEARLGKYMRSINTQFHKEMAAMVKISAEFIMSVGVYGLMVWNCDAKGNADMDVELLLGSTMLFISAFMGHVFQLGARDMYATFTAVCRTYVICIIFLGYVKFGIAIGVLYLVVTLAFYRLNL